MCCLTNEEANTFIANSKLMLRRDVLDYSLSSPQRLVVDDSLNSSEISDPYWWSEISISHHLVLVMDADNLAICDNLQQQNQQRFDRGFQHQLKSKTKRVT